MKTVKFGLLKAEYIDDKSHENGYLNDYLYIDDEDIFYERMDVKEGNHAWEIVLRDSIRDFLMKNDMGCNIEIKISEMQEQHPLLDYMKKFK